MQKLGYVKEKLKVWNKTTFGNLKANIDKLNEELWSIDTRVEEELGCSELREGAGMWWLHWIDLLKLKRFIGTRRLSLNGSKRGMEILNSSTKWLMGKGGKIR